MAVDFKTSETAKNLMRAFAGESQARNRYVYSAEQAKKSGLYVVEMAFKFTASQEEAHGKVFYDFLKDQSGTKIEMDGSYPVDNYDDVLKLLRAAQNNELEEFSPVYPAFAKIANEEGFNQIGAKFSEIAKIEETHSKRFEQLADWIEQGKLFVSDVQTQWMCLNCGYVHTSTEAPKACPVCGHNQGYFVRLEFAPYTKG